jgi:uncharacterized membrane protein
MSTSASRDGGRKHSAGAYDVRTFIAGLIGFYGVVLALMGIFSDSADDQHKTGGVNANLWAGLVMVVVAIAFAVWTRLRPVVVDERAVAETREGVAADNTPGH